MACYMSPSIIHLNGFLLFHHQPSPHGVCLFHKEELNNIVQLRRFGVPIGLKQLPAPTNLLLKYMIRHICMRINIKSAIQFLFIDGKICEWTLPWPLKITDRDVIMKRYYTIKTILTGVFFEKEWLCHNQLPSLRQEFLKW